MKSPMGEQEILSPSNPVFIVIMRNSRGKLFVYVAILGVLCFIVFLLSNTHSSLKELEGINEKCQQQRDSLSAQLQVVYEHKNRLEKSLQQEKTDHRQTKEVSERQIHELEFKLQEEKDKEQKLEVQVSQLKTNYAELEEDKGQTENALKEQLKTVQNQKDAEIEKLQTHISELLAEKDKLEMSNNAFTWKLEQHASEVNLCHLQQEQTQKELATCQETLKNHQKTTNEIVATKKEEKNVEDKMSPLENEGRINEINDKAQEPVHEEPLVVEEPKEKGNKTTFSSAKSEKQTVLEKPNVLPPHSAAGDNVLPKPLSDKAEEENRDIDAAVELADKNDEKLPKKAVDVNEEKDLQNKIDTLNLDTKNSPDNLDIDRKKERALAKDLENHPQVLPPESFADNAGEKDDHAAERGEYGPQYALGEVKQQVEVPDMKKHAGKVKNVESNNDLAAAQMQDMMNKSPGDVNNPDEQNALRMPPQEFGAIDNKIKDLKNAESFLHRGADAHHVMDEKNYEEDDDDRENDDEPLNGAAAGMKGLNVLQDNDFDDQENQDNADNAKEEEGVVVAPK